MQVEPTNHREPIVLSTGRRLPYHIVGLHIVGDEQPIHYGYDGHITWPVPDWWDKEEVRLANPLTNAEVHELATYMAKAWAALANSIKEVV